MAIHYRTQALDDVSIFYREAGPADAPTLVVLHGFPASSHMFRDLIPKRAQHCHLIAPDYPGFGYRDAPTPTEFSCTFDHLTDIMHQFLKALGLDHLALYVQDYGAPIGFRIARAIARDLPQSELHLFDTGHFALEEDGDVIAPHIRRFLKAHLTTASRL